MSKKEEIALEAGAEASIETVVTGAMTAARFARDPGEIYPEVLATPFMIGEMERAAAVLMRPLLREGEISVGARVEIAHLAPTPVGSVLRSHARFIERDRGLFWFEVWAEDAAGLVGEGRHARAIVRQDEIDARSRARSQPEAG